MISQKYEKEYGFDELFMHQDAVKPGQRVLIVDDVLAKGNTINAVAKMVTSLGGVITGFSFLIELPALMGRQVLAPHQVNSVLQY